MLTRLQFSILQFNQRGNKSLSLFRSECRLRESGCLQRCSRRFGFPHKSLLQEITHHEWGRTDDLSPTLRCKQWVIFFALRINGNWGRLKWPFSVEETCKFCFVSAGNLLSDSLMAFMSNVADNLTGCLCFALLYFTKLWYWWYLALWISNMNWKMRVRGEGKLIVYCKQ